jgi:signal transduction histidine kinase
MFALHRKWVLGALIVIPAVGEWTTAIVAPGGFWSEFFARLYYVPIIIAGLEYGWKAGLGFAILAGLSHSVIAREVLGSPIRELRAPVVAFLVVGFALAEQRRRSAQSKASAKTAETAAGPVDTVNTKDCVEQVSEIASELLREIRTPFAGIEGAAYILDETTALENRKEFVDIIRCECRRVNRVLSEMEESTEIIPLKRAPADAASLLGEVVRLSALGNPDPAISLRIEVAPDLPPLWCDAKRIEQTLVPFVTNAMTGMTGGGELLLSAGRQGDQARIQLRVLGQTIHGADPFAGRGQYSSTFDASSGVRVLAARRTLLQHGGTITVERTGHIKKLSSLTLPLYNGQTP